MIDEQSHIRIARPSGDLATVERFYVQGLGLSVLYRASEPLAPGEHQLLMVGWPNATWHLELTRDPISPVSPSPTPEDLLVIYLNGPVADALIERLVDSGGRRVRAHNAYWDRFGVTIADPDGYRLVMCTRSWSNAG